MVCMDISALCRASSLLRSKMSSTGCQRWPRSHGGQPLVRASSDTNYGPSATTRLICAGRSYQRYDPPPLTTTNDHWLDELTAAIHAHREALSEADLDALALQTCPPVDLFVRGSWHVSVGRD